MDVKDIQIKCATCGRDFIFTAREQEFFSSKGFKEPRHCRECRNARKQDRDKRVDDTQRVATHYKSGYKVTCAQCQRESFVPFKPITGKPVLCKDCFIAQRYGAQPKPPAEELPPPSAEVDHQANPESSSAELPSAFEMLPLPAVTDSNEGQTSPAP